MPPVPPSRRQRAKTSSFPASTSSPSIGFMSPLFACLTPVMFPNSLASEAMNSGDMLITEREGML